MKLESVKDPIVGDKVFDLQYGSGVVIEVKDINTVAYPVHVVFSAHGSDATLLINYTPHGKEVNSCAYPTLFKGSIEDCFDNIDGQLISKPQPVELEVATDPVAGDLVFDVVEGNGVVIDDICDEYYSTIVTFNLYDNITTRASYSNEGKAFRSDTNPRLFKGQMEDFIIIKQ